MVKNSSGTMSKIGVGLLSGIVGGALSFGGLNYISNQQSHSPSTSVASQSGPTKVSNVRYDVKSDVTDAVEKVQGAVVSIVNLQSPQTQSNDFFGRLFGSEENTTGGGNEQALQPASEGSGVIYKKDGNTAYIVTNNHVVDGQKALQVLLADGTKVKATLVGTDSYTDLAVIKIDSDKISATASFGDSTLLKVGEPAIAIGSPLGSQYANSVTEGIVSSLNRQVSSTNEEGQEVNINAIQTDAAINPGNSGGPLINIKGQIIGINSSKIANSSGASKNGVSVEGMGFAIPSNDVLTIINQLEKNGKITRPALGVSMYDLSSISAEQQEKILKVPSSVTNGVVVLSVSNGTPAEKADIKKYDVITKIDGKDVKNTTELRAALYKKTVGDIMEITFYRESKEQTVKATLSVDQSILKQSSKQSNGE